MRGFTLAITVGIALTFTACESVYGLNFLAGSDCDGANRGCNASCCDSDACDLMSGCNSCGVCGSSAAGCGCLGRMKLLGCIKPSERCFDDFISPMINFVFFEDPRTLSEIRPIFVHHSLPSTLAGGSVQLYAMQFRIALTDRLSLIAVKDGFIVNNSHGRSIPCLMMDGQTCRSA